MEKDAKKGIGVLKIGRIANFLKKKNPALWKNIKKINLLLNT